MPDGPTEETRVIIGEDQNLYCYEVSVPKASDQQTPTPETEIAPTATKEYPSRALLIHAGYISLGAEHPPRTTLR